MQTQLRLSVVIAFALGLFTIVLGTLGWLRLSDAARDVLEIGAAIPFLSAVYRAVQALALADDYARIDPGQDPLVVLAGFLGFLTTLSAFVALVLGFFGARLAILRERMRRRHTLIVGDDSFATSYWLGLPGPRRCGITVFAHPEVYEQLRGSFRRRGLRVLPMFHGAKFPVGRPAVVVFGEPDTIRNIETARRLLPMCAGAEIVLRVEDPELSRAESGMPEALLNARILSRNEITARAVVSTLDLSGMAELRGQLRPHLGFIGFGSRALAIAEEVALRCHGPGLGRTRISVFDRDVGAARRRLECERPGLGQALEIGFSEFDGLACGADAALDTLRRAEAAHPFTALIVAAGDDAVNMAIGLQIARVQADALICKAPVLLQNSHWHSISPEPPTDLTGGLVLFGGEHFDRHSLEIEAVSASVARLIHSTWQKSLPPAERAAHDWERTSHRNRRSGLRAALSGLELLRAAGLVPEPGHGPCGFRSYRPHVHALLGDRDRIETLARMENDRWSAEKLSDGYRPAADGWRDEEKRRHPLLRPYDALPEAEKEKDRDQVRAILEGSAALLDAAPERSCWRRRLRIGVVGVLAPGPELIAALDGLPALVSAELGVAFADCALEVLSPNAPGFDRLAAQKLLAQFRAQTGRAGALVLIEAVRLQMLDRMAEAKLDPARMHRQSADLMAAAGTLRRIDLRPPGLSDVDIEAQGLFHDLTLAAADEVDRLSDLVIFGLGGGEAAASRRSLARRQAAGRPCLVL